MKIRIGDLGSAVAVALVYGATLGGLVWIATLDLVPEMAAHGPAAPHSVGEMVVGLPAASLGGESESAPSQ